MQVSGGIKMFDKFNKEWEFNAYVWLDEDDFDEFRCKCVCSSKEYKYLKRFKDTADMVASAEDGTSIIGKYSESKAEQFMDEMVYQSSKLADFRQRAYLAALQGAKEYIKTMGKHQEVRPLKKDMMEAPDTYSLKVVCHYYAKSIL